MRVTFDTKTIPCILYMIGLAGVTPNDDRTKQNQMVGKFGQNEDCQTRVVVLTVQFPTNEFLKSWVLLRDE